jgi:hypothetical protein
MWATMISDMEIRIENDPRIEIRRFRVAMPSALT